MQSNNHVIEISNVWKIFGAKPEAALRAMLESTAGKINQGNLARFAILFCAIILNQIVLGKNK